VEKSALVTCQWLKGEALLREAAVQTVKGGAPVALPAFSLPSSQVGTCVLTLRVSDGINSPVSATITVSIIDTLAPTLAPVADKTILWPPNRQMVPVTIMANASDNSGLPVALRVAVASNETQPGQIDWTEPIIDQMTGTITLQLRAECFPKGTGQQYTVTIVATDESGNESAANVKILVPRNPKG